MASPENRSGASLVARSHLPLHLLNHVLKATVCAPSSPRSLSLSPGGFRAETFCTLERSGWWLEDGQRLRPGRWVRAWRPRNSALGSTRLCLGYCPLSCKAGKGLMEKFKPGQKETIERFLCARSCTDTGHSKMSNTQPPPSRSSKFGGLQRDATGFHTRLGKRACDGEGVRVGAQKRVLAQLGN